MFAAIISLDRKRIKDRIYSVLGYLPSSVRSRARNDPNAVALRDVAAKMRSGPSSPAKCDLATQLGELEARFKDAHKTLLPLSSKVNDAAETQTLADIVIASYNFSTGGGRLRPVERLFAAGLNGVEWSKDKRVNQIDKIGAYWRIARSFAQHFSPAGGLSSFTTISLESVDAYQALRSTQSKSGKAVRCHVHVELQMVVHYLLAHGKPGPPPRIIGVSKDACFLCFLFLGCYGNFQIPQTHGKLHEQWTIPDLKTFTEGQKAKLRRTIEQIDQIVFRLGNQHIPKQVHASQSRHNFGELPGRSPTASTVTVTGMASVAEVLHEDESGQLLTRSGHPPNQPVVDDLQNTAAPSRAEAQSNQRSSSTLRPQEAPPQSVVVGRETRVWTDLSAEPRRIDEGQMKGVEVYGEIQSPSQGRAQIYERLDDSETAGASVIDIETLAPGEEVTFFKADGSQGLQVLLRGLKELSCQLELEWVEDD